MNKFKNSNLRYLYKDLFFEVSKDPARVLYTLKDEDREGLPSLKRLYLECFDVTEYIFATKYFNDYDHWYTLTKQTWFKKIVSEWRRELELKIKSLALKNLLDTASSLDEKSTTKVAINRFLLEGKWSINETKHKEEPISKEEIKGKAKERSDEDKYSSSRPSRNSASDLERIKGMN